MKYKIIIYFCEKKLYDFANLHIFNEFCRKFEIKTFIQNEMCNGFIIFYHSRKTYEEEFCIQLSSLNFKNLKCFKHL